MTEIPPFHDAHAALRDGRWPDAAAAFLDGLRSADDPDARFGLAIALFWTGETVAAIREWERAYVAFRRAEAYSQAALAAGYLCLAYQMSMGNDVAARGWLERTARLIADHGVGEMTAWLLVCRAHLALDAGELPAAVGFAGEAADLARAAGDLDLELCALGELGAAILEQGRVEEGTALLDEAMAGVLAGEGRNLDSVVLVSCRSITACSRAGDLRRATRWIRAADAFHRRYGSPHLYTTCRTNFGSILFATGRWEDAERELRAALEIGEAGEPALHAEALAKLAEMRVAQGRLEEAARLLAGLEDHAAAANAIALIRLAHGQPSAAATILRRRLHQVDESGLEAAAVQELLIEVEIALGAVDRADELATALRRRRASGTSAIVRARGERALGLVRLAASRGGDAVEHLERAALAFAHLEMPVEAARARLLIARAMAETDVEAATAEAQAAFTTFTRVGALRDADAAAAFLRSRGIRAVRSGPGAHGALTKREREVLALLGEGLSNPEIGTRLFITRKTVEHHVASVLAKIGLSGRSEAAAYAVRHDRDSAPK